MIEREAHFALAGVKVLFASSPPCAGIYAEIPGASGLCAEIIFAVFSETVRYAQSEQAFGLT